jgi:type I restriction enzyme S subunit
VTQQWAHKALEELLSLNRSGYWGDETPSKARPIEVKVIRNADLTKHNSIKGSASRYFSPKEAANAELQIGDIAMSSSGDVGKAWLVNEPGYSASNFIRILRPNGNYIMPSFLRYVLESDQGQVALKASTAGTTIQNLQKTFYSMLIVPLPPLAEQQRIVRLLDEAFEGIATAKANAEKNLQNARALFESRLQAVIQTCFDKAETTKLENLCAPDAPIIYGILQPGPHQPSGIPFVRPTEMQDGVIEASSLHRTSLEIAKRYKRSTLATGDIILSIVGTIGKVAVVEEWLQGGNITQSSARIRADKTKIKPDFLRYLLLSSQLKNQFESVRMGTAVTRLNIAHVRALHIPVLPMQRQQEIVDELSNVALACKNLVQVMNRKSALIDALGASLLEACFSNNGAAA